MKKKDIFVQESPSSCGACSVASIVSYYGGYIPLDIIIEDTKTDKNGTTALYLKEALEKYGFLSSGFKVKPDELRKCPLPAIIHVSKDGLEHFLVLYSIENDKYIVMDPAVGKKTYSKAEFESMMTGTLISATPNGAIPKYGHSKSLLNLLIPLIKDVKCQILLVLILSLISLGLNLILSFHLKLLDSTSKIILLTLAFVLFRLIGGSIEYCRLRMIFRTEKYVDDSSLHAFTTHVFKLPIKMLKNRRVGEIMRKIEGMSFVKDLFLRITIETPIDVMGIIFPFILMILISPKLTLIYFIIVIVYLMINIFTKKIIYDSEKRLTQLNEDYMGTLVEYLEGIESIKNLNGEEKFLNNLLKSLGSVTDYRNKKNRKNAFIEIAKLELIGVGTLIINLVGFVSLSPTFTFLDLLTLNSVFQIFQSSCEKLFTTIVDTTKYRALLKNISEFYDLETEKDGISLNEPLRKLTVDNLRYTFNHIDYVLTDFTYELNIGESLLIKGPSGIGKSTFVKCLSGYDMDFEGNISLNGVSIKNMSTRFIKENIVYVGQEEKLFTMSIYDNIAIEKSDSKLFEKVAKITLLNKILDSKRERENTVLLEGASNLSGGERSRVILARSLYKNPKILIIDETLSSISEDDEDEIIKRLLALKNISIIYITHRNKDKFFNNIIEFRKEGKYEIKRKRTI